MSGKVKINMEDVVEGVDEKIELGEAITDEFLNEAKRSRSRSDWSSLIILHTALKSIDDTIEEINKLTTEYRDIEKSITMRIYPENLVEANLISPKTLLGGKDRVDVNMFYEAFRAFVTELKSYIEDINKIKQRDVTDIRNVIRGFFRDVHVTSDIDKVQDELLLSFNKLLLIKETSRGEDVLELTNNMVKIASYVCDEKNIKFEFPKLTAVETAKSFRDLLIRTQSVGRQAEIFFTYYLGKLLYQHPQLRKDYADVEKYTNALFQNLSVTRAELTLSGVSVADALKKIMKCLYNIRGDFNALRLVLSMNTRKSASKSVIEEYFKNIGKKDKGSK